MCILITRKVFLFIKKSKMEDNKTPAKKQKVVLDADMCIWCGACVAIANTVFDFDDNGKSYVKKQPSTDKEIEEVDESIEACCVSAIKWED